MADTTDRAEDWVKQANELYWTTSKSVDEIVDDLGVSRSSLYASLEPVPAGLVCTDCQERMVFTNRTARDRGMAVCPRCGMESDVGESSPEGTAAGESADGVDGGDGWGFSRWRGELAGVSPERVAMVGGAAALGMMLGAVAARAVRDSR